MSNCSNARPQAKLQFSTFDDTEILVGVLEHLSNQQKPTFGIGKMRMRKEIVILNISIHFIYFQEEN